MKHQGDRCGRGSGKEHPAHGGPGSTGNKKCEHRRVKHNKQDGSCAFCRCGGFIERMPR